MPENVDLTKYNWMKHLFEVDTNNFKENTC